MYPTIFPLEQKQASAVLPLRKKIFRIIIFSGGVAGLLCLCLMAVMGYRFFSFRTAVPAGSTMPETVDTTQQVVIQLTQTKVVIPKQLTATIQPSLTKTRVPTFTFTPRPTATATKSLPFGKIVFSCQMDGENHDQICIINADGSGWRQLTDNGKHNWYASISPDGQSVVYSSNMTGNNYEIYEISVRGSNLIQLTSRLGGKLYAPEVSPDGNKIVFTHDDNGFQSIWVMDRDGSNPHRISPDDGWDPSWSSDGGQILFASLTPNGSVQLFTMDGSGLNQRQVTNMSGLIGRSDMSPTGEYVATYAGKYGSRSIYLIPMNGVEPTKYFFDPTSAAPSFSPDGQWMVFTGYLDHPNDFDRGCEIYLVKLKAPEAAIRLTDNNYCDWQPRWGP
ncbi:hypothetical protein [Candidatus Villigracilis saccharophilus]|uniref:TolB family protein n=1 Tax=Candidatus Villigracilis saccharophilus TaxID=3140684 RepID=UPI003136727A|nr:PD40 domain-containing protein [Anaerolineales bacterium]